MAVNVETVEPYRADWRQGRLTSLLTTVDHKRIGLMYIWTSLVLLRDRRDSRAAPADAARDAERAHPDEGLVQRGVDRARHDDDLPRRRPDLAGFGNYLVPLMIGARDMAFPRLNALSLLAVPARRIVIMYAASSPKHGRARQAGWTSYVPPLPSAARSRATARTNWILGLHILLDLVARRGDQHHRDDAHMRTPGHDVHAHAALRLGAS